MQIKFSKLYTLALVMGVTIISCDDMNSIHEKYLSGEQVYAGKLDSLRVFSGFERIKIIGNTQYLGNSKEATISWDDQTRTFPIDNIVNNKFEIIIDGLLERNYEFELYTTDNNNNKSVKQSLRGRVYGNVFKTGQTARRIIGFDFLVGGDYILWANKAESEYVVFTKVRYENNSGGMTEAIVYPNETSTLMINWKVQGKIEIISTIISGNFGFDTAVLDLVENQLPILAAKKFDKSMFRLVNMSSDNPGTFYGANPSQYLFDGNDSWSGNDAFGFHSGENSKPMHFTIDLGSQKQVTKCELGLRAGFTGNNPTQIEVWGRTDLVGAATLPVFTSSGNNVTSKGVQSATLQAAGWQLLFRGPIDGVNNQIVNFDINAAGQAYRYLKFGVLASPGGGVQLTELTFFGYN
jgi:hypothetical protein